MKTSFFNQKTHFVSKVYTIPQLLSYSRYELGNEFYFKHLGVTLNILACSLVVTSYFSGIIVGMVVLSILSRLILAKIATAHRIPCFVIFAPSRPE